jgi:hypothetical protein
LSSGRLEPSKSSGSNAKGNDSTVNSLIRAAMAGGASASAKSVDAGIKSEGGRAFKDEDLDALISYPPESLKNGGDTSKSSGSNDNAVNKKKAKELVGIEDSLLSGVGYTDKREKDRQGSKRGEKEKGDKGNDSKSQGKDRGQKGKDKPSNADGHVPPAPALVVPPPPANEDKNSKGKRGKDNKKSEKANTSTPPTEILKAGKDDKGKAKESMLVKINNPFLDSKGKKTEEHADAGTSSLLSTLIVDPPVSRSSGPPKDQPSRVVSVVKDSKDKSRDAKEKDRGKAQKESDVLAALNKLKLDESIEKKDDKAAEGSKDKSEKDRSRRRRRRRKDGKDGEDHDDKDSSPSPAPNSRSAEPNEKKSLSMDNILVKVSTNDEDFARNEPFLPRPTKKGPPALPHRPGTVPVDDASSASATAVKEKDSTGAGGVDVVKEAKAPAVEAVGLGEGASRKACVVPPPPGLSPSTSK